MVKQNFNTVEEITIIPGEIRPIEADQVVTYTLTPSVSFANVVIDQGTGKVSIAAIGGRIGRQMITAVADDGQAENNTYSQTFYLEIRSTLNTSPLDITLSSFNIPENQPVGSTIATINVIDNDANDVHQIEFIQNDMYPDNVLFTIEGNALKNNQVLNFEEQNRMILNLKATDKVGNALSKQLVINITNINDLPADIGLSSLNVRKNLTIGGVVGEFTTNDDDPNDVHTYALVGEAPDNARFVITGNKLILNSNMDVSEGTDMQIRVRTDDGSEGFEKDFTLKVVSSENIFADIKTGFTPNGDGWNNTWKIDNIESYPNAKVEIYDSWGRRVFFSVGYAQEWDGTFENKELPAGTYYYIIDTFTGKPAKGTVTLMR
jgi:gliding motility-associated-like protein